MSEPIKKVWDCGRDIYGRQVTMSLDRDSGGKRGLGLEIAPYNQRDDGHRVHTCLTRQNILAMAEAIKDERGI